VKTFHEKFCKKLTKFRKNCDTFRKSFRFRKRSKKCFRPNHIFNPFPGGIYFFLSHLFTGKTSTTYMFLFFTDITYLLAFIMIVEGSALGKKTSVAHWRCRPVRQNVERETTSIKKSKIP
jgi:hypothetical protein